MNVVLKECYPNVRFPRTHVVQLQEIARYPTLTLSLTNDLQAGEKGNCREIEEESLVELCS